MRPVVFDCHDLITQTSLDECWDRRIFSPVFVTESSFQAVGDSIQKPERSNWVIVNILLIF